MSVGSTRCANVQQSEMVVLEEVREANGRLTDHGSRVRVGGSRSIEISSYWCSVRPAPDCLRFLETGRLGHWKMRSSCAYFSRRKDEWPVTILGSNTSSKECLPLSIRRRGLLRGMAASLVGASSRSTHAFKSNESDCWCADVPSQATTSTPVSNTTGAFKEVDVVGRRGRPDHEFDKNADIDIRRECMMLLIAN